MSENLSYFARITRGTRHIDEVIELVGLGDVAGAEVRRLSGGQLSRVSLATALVGRPDVLVLDEPRVGLVPVLRRDLWDTFHKLARAGRTSLVSSHVMTRPTVVTGSYCCAKVDCSLRRQRCLNERRK